MLKNSKFHFLLNTLQIGLVEQNIENLAIPSKSLAAMSRYVCCRVPYQPLPEGGAEQGGQRDDQPPPGAQGHLHHHRPGEHHRPDLQWRKEAAVRL